jgi:hypothetical protein
MRKEVVVIVHPPITRSRGVLCINRGGTRGMLPLRDIKRIEDRIKLPIRL